MGVPRAFPEVLCDLRGLSETIAVKRITWCVAKRNAKIMLVHDCPTLFISFAPMLRETDAEASNPGPGKCRPRLRGPRSQEATERRRSRWSQALDRDCCATCVPAEEDASNSNKPALIHDDKEGKIAGSLCYDADQYFCILHCDVNGFMSKAVQILARVRLEDAKPEIICINESCLDESIEEIKLEGYEAVARRDRQDGRRKGGVVVFAALGIAPRVTCAKNSDNGERVWLVVHSCRPILAWSLVSPA